MQNRKLMLKIFVFVCTDPLKTQCFSFMDYQIESFETNSFKTALPFSQKTSIEHLLSSFSLHHVK